MRRESLLGVAALLLGVLGLLAPAQAVDCYPPGSCDVAATPMYLQVPGSDLPSATVYAGWCSRGLCTAADVVRTVTAGGLSLRVADGPTIRILPLTGAGTPRQVAGDGTMLIENVAGVSFWLTGLRPGTWVDIYFNSQRTFLGKAKVGADGTAQGTMPLPSGVGAGEHTAQFIATSKSGKVLNAAVGVLVSSRTLSKSKPRYLITAAKPAVGAKAEQLVPMSLSVKLADLLVGRMVTGAAARALPSCTVKASVRAETGRMLLPWTCLRSSGGGNTAGLNWIVPTGYEGKASLVFVAREPGRPAYRVERSIVVLG